jgi:hypothetical protein
MPKQPGNNLGGMPGANLGGGGNGGIVKEWVCTRCFRVLSTGNSPPIGMTCPGCGARITSAVDNTGPVGGGAPPIGGAGAPPIGGGMPPVGGAGGGMPPAGGGGAPPMGVGNNPMDKRPVFNDDDDGDREKKPRGVNAEVREAAKTRLTVILVVGGCILLGVLLLGACLVGGIIFLVAKSGGGGGSSRPKRRRPRD